MSIARTIRSAAVAVCLTVLTRLDAASPANLTVWTNQFTEADAALLKLQLSPGFKIDTYAAEPLLQNPTSFAFDERGRLFVVETHRRRTSVFDIRNFPEWLDQDFSFRRPVDRENFFRRTLTPANTNFISRMTRNAGRGFGDFNRDGRIDAQDLEVESERVRLIEDRDGDGRAETSTVFSDDYRTAISGVAAGIVARGREIWFTCIPDLWRLRDSDGDGRADVKELLQHGFGVHIAFGGHDLHGLRFGPDGRLYFSIADRGAHLETREGRIIALPDTGAIFRCLADGSELEVVATGLRNPQELAFDQVGNLWTVDNNGDGGDRARLVQVADGGDSGWTMGWQWLPKMGAWNSERLWELAPTNTARAVLPPVAHVGHGPAGFAFYPGTGLPREFDGHFLLADFPGGIRHFTVVPTGAGFAVSDPAGLLQDNSPGQLNGKLLWGLYPVDVDFGPDGSVYVADWIQGWEKTGKGRIYRIHHPRAIQDPEAVTARNILGAGMRKRSISSLAALLGNPDQRVRQEAQFELASRGDASVRTLVRSARQAPHLPARLHAIWALGQIGTGQHPGTAPPRVAPASRRAISGTLAALVRDPDPEVRAQAARGLGDLRFNPATPLLIELLRDNNDRVRFFAAQSLGMLGSTAAVSPLFDLASEKSERDGYLRHACVFALARIGATEPLLSALRHPVAPVRLTALLALRRLRHPAVAELLQDPDPQLALEAARAIHDTPIDAAQGLLASLLDTPAWGRSFLDTFRIPILRRAIQANASTADDSAVARLASCASDRTMPDALRAEALDALAQWSTPPARDRITGLWRPRPPSDPTAVRRELSRHGMALLQGGNAVKEAAARAAGSLDLQTMAPLLSNLACARTESPEVRLACLQGLAKMQAPDLKAAVEAAAASGVTALQAEAARLRLQEVRSLPAGGLAELLATGTVPEQQQALRTAARSPGPETDRLLTSLLADWRAGRLQKELQLDVLEAARAQPSPVLRETLRAFETERRSDTPEVPEELLFGGGAGEGRTLFFEKQEVACLRCHKMGREGGDVGPDLTHVASRLGRKQILESILYPNRIITAGYETAIIRTKSGETVAGVVREESAQELVINSPEDGLIRLAKNTIDHRERGLSPMPEGFAEMLSPRELRDLIEFLAQQK